MAFSIIFALLIFLCLAGLCGLFLSQSYIHKISALSVSYSSFLIMIVLLSLKSSLMNEVMVILVSILAIFSVNLLIGIGIVKNIAEAEEAKPLKD